MFSGHCVLRYVEQQSLWSFAHISIEHLIGCRQVISISFHHAAVCPEVHEYLVVSG